MKRLMKPTQKLKPGLLPKNIIPKNKWTVSQLWTAPYESTLVGACCRPQRYLVKHRCTVLLRSKQ